jgi:hypothetical protein
VKNAKFYLSLYDIDPDETVGGARDFTSANNNDYVRANYKRAPLEKDKMGTICLPFAIEESNAIMQKYDFFKLKSGDATSLTFSQVTELENNKPYLYKLKDGVASNANVDAGLDVFQSAGEVKIETLAKFTYDDTPGATALGSFVNYYIQTSNYPKSAFYYFNIEKQ